MRAFSGLLLVLLALSGCATRFNEGTQSANRLELKGQSNNNETFRLYGSFNRLIATAQPRPGAIAFDLPDRVYDKCVGVFDAAGKSVTGDKYFRLSARAEYEEAIRARANAGQERSKDVARLVDAQTTASRLNANRAYSNQSCTLPPRRQTPVRPQVKCASRSQCEQEGAAICFTRYWGQKGCTKALDSRTGAPGILSNPACAKIAASLAGEKYEMPQAVVDALEGGLEDLGREFRNSDSFWYQLFGIGIGLRSEILQLREANSCTVRFIDEYYGPLEQWQRDVEQLRTEPDRLLAACIEDSTKLPFLWLAVPSIESSIAHHDNRLRAIDSRIAELSTQPRPIEWCEKRDGRLQ